MDGFSRGKNREAEFEREPREVEREEELKEERVGWERSSVGVSFPGDNIRKGWEWKEREALLGGMGSTRKTERERD